MGPVSLGVGPVPSVRQSTDSASQLRPRSVVTVKTDSDSQPRSVGTDSHTNRTYDRHNNDQSMFCNKLCLSACATTYS